MNSKLSWKVGILAVVFIWSLVQLYPNIVWYSVPLAQRAILVCIQHYYGK